MGRHLTTIELGMPDPGAGGHTLHVACPNHGLGTKAILMRHCTVEDNSDDFHFLVGMRAKTSVRGDHIVVEHAQGTKLDIRWVIILAKRKQPVCFQPAKVRKVAFISTNDLDHCGSFLCGYIHCYHGGIFAYNERHARAIQSAHSRRISSVSICRPINTKTD